jgi:hypothetical protein
MLLDCVLCAIHISEVYEAFFAAIRWARNFCTFVHAVCFAGCIAWRAYREGILFNKAALSLGIQVLIAVLCVVFINCNFVHHAWFSSPSPTTDISWDCFWCRYLNRECVVFTVCASESGSEQWTPLQWNFSQFGWKWLETKCKYALTKSHYVVV